MDDDDKEFRRLYTDPSKFLELMNELVDQNPADAHAYFRRHWAWKELGSPALALDDLDKSLTLEDHYVTHRVKGRLLYVMGRYKEAIASLDRCQQAAPAKWPEAFGPLLRADCYARLGDEAAALADRHTLPDDH